MAEYEIIVPDDSFIIIFNTDHEDCPINDMKSDLKGYDFENGVYDIIEENGYYKVIMTVKGEAIETICNMENKNNFIEATNYLISSKTEEEVISRTNLFLYDKSPLFGAVKEKDLALAKIILDAGGDPNARNGVKMTTILECACIYAGIDMVCLLLYKGAKVCLKDNNGRTSLHWRSKLSDYEIARILLDHGARIDERDLDGNTPISISEKRGDTKMINLLKNYPDNIKISSLDDLFMLSA